MHVTFQMDHYASYSGVQYSPLDMAEYVFWTGDEHGVTAAVEEFLQEGMVRNYIIELGFHPVFVRRNVWLIDVYSLYLL